MCKSVKGAAFFGSSIHVVAAFTFLCWFLFDTVISEMGINLWKCFPPDDDHPRKVNVIVHYLNLLFKFLYYISLCVTGIYIFRGVERANPRIIKFALLVFVIVQAISLAIFIAVSLTYWEDDPVDISSIGIANSLVDENSVPTNQDDGSGFQKELNNNGGGSIIELIIPSSDELLPVLESPLTPPTTPETTLVPEIKFPKVPRRFEESNTTSRKLSHDQLVSFVFQILFVGFNAVGSTIYSIVMVFYLMTL